MSVELLFCIAPFGVLCAIYVFIRYRRTGSFGGRLDEKIQLIKDASSSLSPNWILFLAIANAALACIFHGYVFVFNLQRNFGFLLPIGIILPLAVAQWLMLRNSFAMRGCLYLSLWITASLLGFYMAGMLGAGLIRSMPPAYWSGDAATQARIAASFGLLRGALSGLGLGVGQWAMLTLLRACWPWWAAINVVSLALAHFLLALWRIAII